MFADDVVICGESRKQMENTLEVCVGGCFGEKKVKARSNRRKFL